MVAGGLRRILRQPCAQHAFIVGLGLAVLVNSRPKRRSRPGHGPHKEHLCAGDISTIKARLKLLDAATALRERGIVPPGARDPGVYRVRGASTVVAEGVDWVEGVREAMARGDGQVTHSHDYHDD